jgi:putative serine protease PepD
MTRKSLPVLLTAAALAGGTGGAAIVTAVDQPAVAATSTAAPATSAAPVASSSATAVYRAVREGVVDVKVGTAEGSGFVIDTKGDIVTNEHVVGGASRIVITFSDGTSATARLVKADASSDLAVVRVTVAASRLHPLTLANSSSVAVGDEVLAVGSPFGLEGSLTTGVVSATGRTIDAPDHAAIPGAIQTDAAINHGNSGGPLLDADGQVIGVNSQIASDSGGSDGVGFAIASNTVKSVVSRLIAGQTVEHASLGVVVGDGSGGAKVGSVTAGGAASTAGVRSGDVITAVDGTPVSGADALAAAVAGHQPGDSVRLTLVRSGGGGSAQVTATLGTR